MKQRAIGFLLMLFLALSQAQPASAQDASGRGLGISIKLSTNGPGADLIWQFHRKAGLRVGFEMMKLNRHFGFTEEEIDYDANLDLRTGSFSLLLNYNLTRNIYLTAGGGWNLFQAVVGGEASEGVPFGDVTIPVDMIGSFRYTITPSLNISPYAGIGFGRTLGYDKRLGFLVELGGFYQGPPAIGISSDGLLSPTSNPAQGQQAYLEKQYSQYTVYPVLKLALSYKVVKTGK